jgi:hypothetical protein
MEAWSIWLPGLVAGYALAVTLLLQDVLVAQGHVDGEASRNRRASRTHRFGTSLSVITLPLLLTVTALIALRLRLAL